MRRFALGLALLLAGCSATPGPDTPKARPSGINVQTDAGGLAITGGASGRIDFGRAPKGVIETLTRELGPGKALALANCPAGITRQMAWGDLVLSFTDERFVGWRGARGSAGQTCGVLA